MKLSSLKEGDCPEYYLPYLKVLGDSNLTDLMERQMGNFPQFIQSIPEELLHHRYAPDKWSVAEVLVHVLDTERIFQYRALRFGRGDTTPLPGFDQDTYVPQSLAENQSIDTLVQEYKVIRESTLLLFKSFPEDRFLFKGNASGQGISLGALGFIICGHQKHHRNILRERYLER
ncbi:DinB family protein [Robiginitalea aurantiaca]|uniref:DinB family protein n=1 Tax=Robiginitalea aurantiaca TaxID=3056915 RepID=A0ABT7WFX7_9FLAO|nr:DinB family protein [Robiginitalea aurantiaca]MDM9631813.1 DinB family protein [Robiginitalea aurantiaca]